MISIRVRRARAFPWMIALALLVALAGGWWLRGRPARASMSHAPGSMSDADMARMVADFYATHPQTGTPAAPTAVPADTVTAQNFQFNSDGNLATPTDTVTILAGQSVLFQWVGGSHTTTNGTDALDPQAGTIWDQPLTSLATQWVQSFPNAGLFPFFCRNHSTMHGFVNVLSAVGVESSPLPRAGFLSAPSPNPSRGAVDFRFVLTQPGHAVAEVFDARGRLVARVLDDDLAAGSHGAAWDGTTTGGARAAAGVYRLRLALPGFTAARTIVIAR